MAIWAEIGSTTLLFFLVFGMSATVDIRRLRKQLRNRNALLTGISLQFIILPFLGFVVVKTLNLSAPMGITLLVITSSPGGSYSNWWCSLFNAELALSVTMTTISTLLSIIMLPVNLILYATTTYSNDVVKALDWEALFISLIVVIGGISTGLVCSATVKNPKFNLLANKMGNIAGISLVIFSVVVSSDKHGGGQLWNQSPIFYIGVGTPCLIGLIIATGMATYFRLEKPERVAVSVECCYQNTGIATSVAAAVFSGDELAVAVGVPLFYGICEACFLLIYCTLCWQMGWTKAPANEHICRVITTSYEVQEMMQDDPESIEVVLGAETKDGPSDLIFRNTEQGLQIDEISLESITESSRKSSEEFPIEDLEENNATNNIHEMGTEQNISPRRGGKKYAALDTQSPSKLIINGRSPKNKNQANDVGGNAVTRTLSSIRARTGSNEVVGKYTKAKPVLTSNDGSEERTDGVYNFNSSRIEEPLPADGKHID